MTNEINTTAAQSSQIQVRTAGSNIIDVITKAKIALHFRRHGDWVGYMNTDNDIAEMEYGFDWLGDSDFDFDAAAAAEPAAHKTNSRYEYVEKHAYNINTNIDGAGTIETLITDMCNIVEETIVTTHDLRRGTTPTITHPPTTTNVDGNTTITTEKTITVVQNTSPTPNERYDTAKIITKATPNLASDILKLKGEYQKGAGLTVIGGIKYYPAHLNVRFNKTIKLMVGINHLDDPATVHFGDNSDEIHLIPKQGFENQFTISPNKITKAELATGAVEITFTNINHSLANKARVGRTPEQVPSILAYHIDSNTPKDSSNNPIIVTDANRVGEMIVLPNKKYYTAKINLIKVKRTNRPAVPAVAATATRVAIPAIPAVTDFTTGPSNYSTHNKDKIIKSITRVLAQANIAVTVVEKDLLNYTGADATGSDNKFLEDTLDAFCKQEIPATAITPAAKIRAKNEIKNRKEMYVFLHDYRAAPVGTQTAMSAFSNTENYPVNKLGFANAALVFNNGTHHDTVHELVHTLGINHTFITEEEEGIIFSPGTPPKKAIYFKKREKDEKHIFQKGRTENLMDYSFGYRYKGSTTFLTHSAPPAPAGSGAHGNYFRTINQTYYVADANFYANPNKLCCLYKWQWEVMQHDDEIVAKTETV